MKDTLPVNEKYRIHMTKYFEEYEKSFKDPESFWKEKAKLIDWFEPFDQVLDESGKPFYRWLVNGKTNMSYNCLDRYISNEKRNKVAFIWIPENGEEKVITYFGLSHGAEHL